MRFDQTNEKGQKELEQFIRMTIQGDRVWMEKLLADMLAEDLLQKVYAITERGRRYLREHSPCMTSQALADWLHRRVSQAIS